jgi:hypothetical protein
LHDGRDATDENELYVAKGAQYRLEVGYHFERTMGRNFPVARIMF